MGSSQSAPNREEAALLVQRLHAMRMQDRDIERDYVSIDTEKGMLTSHANSPSLSISSAETWEKQLLADPKNRLALSALMQNDVRNIISQKVATLPDTQTYNVKIPFEGSPVTNQRSSGRCWLFATTNVLRVPIMKKYNLKEFELSQSYLFFWDKLEKSNWFLEQIIDTSDMDLDSRIVQELLGSPVSDGGQWDMAANLVHKYGLVPQTLYPDSYNAMNSGAMGSIITSKLREDALKLRSIKQQATSGTSSKLAAMKARMLQEVHCILTLMLGPPPKPEDKFSWDHYDSNGKFHQLQKTPLDFAADISSSNSFRTLGAKVSDMFSLVNDPRNPYMKLLTVDRLGNVVGGRPVTYVNVDMSTMKAAAISMLKAGIPVFFGSDVGKYSNSTTGTMDTRLYDYKLAFNVSLDMSKSQRLRTRESASMFPSQTCPSSASLLLPDVLLQRTEPDMSSTVTHAMTLTAVHLDPSTGKPIRWRVQNSWGTSAGTEGYMVMTDAWMDEFVYQVVVDPGYVGKEIKEILGTKAKRLDLWDPMGALA
ncbi:Cysteine proteinase 1, mitochondrial [Cyphellophora attinorum]|uniref:Cysteine proteinase 1, mitochondrial n=1 Tax=Cyphellophora attinorum TaxID=1664694 RepID=A0A0N1HBE1_9EURO|nr:Cysteine proteinase 1, mitochondrial [Phialophora attinorum]KPI40562.1 Cysteine proteinase 1, mitochondrial [Phialophora attinorum]